MRWAMMRKLPHVQHKRTAYCLNSDRGRWQAILIHEEESVDGLLDPHSQSPRGTDESEISCWGGQGSAGGCVGQIPHAASMVWLALLC